MSIRSRLEKELRGLPSLRQRVSRFGDSKSYFVADLEVAHFHGDQRMDVRLTKERIHELRDEGSLDVRVHTRGRYAEWASLPLLDERDVALAVEMVLEAIRANS